MKSAAQTAAVGLITLLLGACASSSYVAPVVERPPIAGPAAKPSASSAATPVAPSAPATAPANGPVTTPLRTAPAVEAKPVTGNPSAGGPPPSTAATSKEAIKSQPKGIKLPYSDQALAQLAGQTQVLPPAGQPPVTPAIAAPSSPPAGKPDIPPPLAGDEKVDWGWPSGGKVLSEFNENTNLKGIGIAGKIGDPVVASAPGRVLFSGDGPRGYGKLVIIKHNETYLSVYAHNSRLLVKEGQAVTKGQKIAEMGNTDSNQVALHFEIRRLSKPVDPLKLLPQRSG